MLTITNYGEGKCCWCCQTMEGVQTKFADGLSGFLCKKHLWEAIKARQTKETSSAESQPGRNRLNVSQVKAPE